MAFLKWMPKALLFFCVLQVILLLLFEEFCLIEDVQNYANQISPKWATSSPGIPRESIFYKKKVWTGKENLSSITHLWYPFFPVFEAGSAQWAFPPPFYFTPT